MNRRTGLRTWFVMASVLLIIWLVAHGSQLKHMGNSIVLGFPPARESVRVAVDPGFRARQLLPRPTINFRADLLAHPVCLGLVLHPGASAKGRLRIRILAGQALLAETALGADEIVDGNNRVCLNLPLKHLQQDDVALEVSSDPTEPVSGVDLVTHRPAEALEATPALAIRLEAHAPWSAMQIASALVIWALTLALLASVLTALSRDSEQVK